MINILLVGYCGSGKTWVMKQIINQLNLTDKKKVELIRFRASNKEKTIVLGKYDGSTFEGSDKLSMAASTSLPKLKSISNDLGLNIICEGDRFTNSTFINLFKPIIIKIKDSGETGRALRGSSQSDRQLKSIQTRVNNIKEHILVNNSNEALKVINDLLNKNNLK